ncbi:MAG: radical SAM protein [Clostridia bacterium]|nr:radical SAM protein [Clostridia bacterium]
MGGEPFLNPRVAEYARFAKRIFSDCDLRIVTNGTLIPKIRVSLLEELKDEGAFLDISSYPPTVKMRRDIKKTLDAAGIGYNFDPPVRFFFKMLFDRPEPSGDRAFSNCLFSHCHMLGHGRLAPCSCAYCAGRLNEHFGTSYLEDDCVDIYSDTTADEILRKFSHVHECCRYCTPGMVPIRWKSGVTADNAKLSDWVVKRDSAATEMLAVFQRAAKRPLSYLRQIIQKR